MKKYRGKKGPKIAAFLLCLLFATAAAVGGAVSLACIEAGYYQGEATTDIKNRFFEKTYATYALKAFRAGKENNYNIENAGNYEFAILEGNVTSKAELKDKSKYIASNFSAGFPKEYSLDTYRIGDHMRYDISETYLDGSYYSHETVYDDVEVEELVYEKESECFYAKADGKYYDITSYVYDTGEDETYTINGKTFQLDDITVCDALYEDAEWEDVKSIQLSEDENEEEILTVNVPVEDTSIKEYTVVSSVAPVIKEDPTDLIYQAAQAYALSQNASLAGPICLTVGGVLAVVFFVILMCLSGYHESEVPSNIEIYQAKKVDEGVYLQRRGLDRIPMDVNLLFVITGIETCVCALIVSLVLCLSWGRLPLIGAALVLVIAAGVFFALLYCMTLASNFKCPKWWKNLFCVMIVTGIIGWFKKIRETSYETGKYMQMKKRIWMIFGLITAGEFLGLFAFANDAGAFGVLFFFWLVEKVAFGVILFKLLNQFAEIKKVTKEIKDGNLTASVDTEKMFLDLREEGDAINSIGRGLDNAIEERLKSERFQTELITNVSHDIKTPLTSIINYVDLLKKEKLEGAKVKEYLDVLDRQSQRLKKLLQDLLDASKASTGNVKLNMEKVDVGVLLNQTLGEFGEKLEASDIDLKVKLPKNPCHIMADSRYLWRVFDNLMNNICKYGQKGTRAYINLDVADAKVNISFLNTSKDELNISGEELMQRFVRGDSSRNTEGSGLGLSIARSLTELMKGKMDLSVDGDLFKVTLTFDVC